MVQASSSVLEDGRLQEAFSALCFGAGHATYQQEQGPLFPLTTYAIRHPPDVWQVQKFMLVVTGVVDGCGCWSWRLSELQTSRMASFCPIMKLR